MFLKFARLFHPNKIIMATGLFTVGSFVYDQSYATVTQNLMARSQLNFKKRYGEQTYVVIAGATSPTGRAFADSFSKQGFNLILVDTDASKLTQVASKFDQAKTVQFDFAKRDDW
jgi:hypothetical protein